MLRVIAVSSIFLACMFSYAYPRDPEGKYQNSEHHDWVKSLHSPAGSWCCDISDGFDADWRSADGHYQVKIYTRWVDVPETAVITEPNRIVRTLVWFYIKDGGPVVNCFLPGSMT